MTRPHPRPRPRTWCALGVLLCLVTLVTSQYADYGDWSQEYEDLTDQKGNIFENTYEDDYENVLKMIKEAKDRIFEQPKEALDSEKYENTVMNEADHELQVEDTRFDHTNIREDLDYQVADDNMNGNAPINDYDPEENDVIVNENESNNENDNLAEQTVNSAYNNLKEVDVFEKDENSEQHSQEKNIHEKTETNSENINNSEKHKYLVDRNRDDSDEKKLNTEEDGFKQLNDVLNEFNKNENADDENENEENFNNNNNDDKLDSILYENESGETFNKNEIGKHQDEIYKEIEPLGAEPLADYEEIKNYDVENTFQTNIYDNLNASPVDVMEILNSDQDDGYFNENAAKQVEIPKQIVEETHSILNQNDNEDYDTDNEGYNDDLTPLKDEADLAEVRSDINNLFDRIKFDENEVFRESFDVENYKHQEQETEEVKEEKQKNADNQFNDDQLDDSDMRLYEDNSDEIQSKDVPHTDDMVDGINDIDSGKKVGLKTDSDISENNMIDDVITDELDLPVKSISDEIISIVSNIKENFDQIDNLEEFKHEMDTVNDTKFKDFFATNRQVILDNFIESDIHSINCTLSLDNAVVITSPNYPEPYKTDGIIDWYFSGEGGTGVEFNITDLELDGNSGDYLLVKPGQKDVSGDGGLVFTFKLDQERRYRFFDVDDLYVRFEAKGDNSHNYKGFSYSVKFIAAKVDRGLSPELEPEPAARVPEETLTVHLSGFRQQDSNTTNEFRRVLVDMAAMYCAREGISSGELPLEEAVQLMWVSACNLNWPDSRSCAAVTFGIPLHAHSAGEYALTAEQLAEMWADYSRVDPFAVRLRLLGISEYCPPDERAVLSWWAVAALVVLLLVSAVGWTVFRWNCFGDYDGMTRLQEDAESVASVRKSNLSLYPTPHQHLPPMFDDDKFAGGYGEFPSAGARAAEQSGGEHNKSFVRDGELLDLDSDEEIVMSLPDHARTPERKIFSAIRPRDVYGV